MHHGITTTNATEMTGTTVAKLRWGRLLCATVVLMVCVSAGAGKPEWAGQGNGNGNGKNKHQQQDDDQGYWQDARQVAAPAPGVNVDIRVGGYFDSRQRTQVQDYYRQESRSGHCPPGLAKKNNGCMPPGQAKKWATGHALPRDVVYTSVDPRILVRLGPPPAGHRFVQVAADILLIAVGTGMVIDAMEDLGR